MNRTRTRKPAVRSCSLVTRRKTRRRKTRAGSNQVGGLFRARYPGSPKSTSTVAPDLCIVPDSTDLTGGPEKLPHQRIAGSINQMIAPCFEGSGHERCLHELPVSENCTGRVCRVDRHQRNGRPWLRGRGGTDSFGHCFPDGKGGSDYGYRRVNCGQGG